MGQALLSIIAWKTGPSCWLILGLSLAPGFRTLLRIRRSAMWYAAAWHCWNVAANPRCTASTPPRRSGYPRRLRNIADAGDAARPDAKTVRTSGMLDTALACRMVSNSTLALNQHMLVCIACLGKARTDVDSVDF